MGLVIVFTRVPAGRAGSKRTSLDRSRFNLLQGQVKVKFLEGLRPFRLPWRGTQSSR